MQLVTLDANKQPDKPVESYDSLIWTERYNTVGDFQITTGDIGGFMQKLPEGTLLSLSESNHVMQVERHLIQRPKNKPATLTIKGRSWESILDRRVAVAAVAGGTSNWTVNVKTPSDAAYYAMYRVCVDGILDAADIFPAAQVQFPVPADYLTGTGPTRSFEIPKGKLLNAVLTLLQTEAREDLSTTPDTPAIVPHGIRAVRPNTAGTAVAIQIYAGTDRSSTLYFDGTRDLLDDGSYLFSKEGSATTAYILGQSSAAKLNTTVANPTGLDRRVILVDGTTSGITDPSVLQAQGEISLSEARITAMFDGSINQDLSPYIYGSDYFLGDIVRLVGNYGLDQKARVTEYIRSQDATGSKSYPTLTRIDE